MNALWPFVKLVAVLGPLLGVLVPAGVFAVSVLVPAWRSRTRPLHQSPLPRFVRALRGFALGAGLVHLALGALFVAWRPPPGSLPAPVPAGDLDAFVRSGWNPWLDLVLDRLAGAGAPPYTGWLAALDTAVATVALPHAVYLVAGSVLLVAGLAEGGATEGSDDGLSPPWLRRLGWPLVLVGSVGALAGLALLPLFADTAALPVTAWASAWVVTVLLVAILLCGARSDPAAAPATTRAAAAAMDLDRLAWERAVWARGFRLERAVHGGGAAALRVAGEPEGDGSVSAGTRWMEAWEPAPSEESFRLLPAGAPDHAPWPHQVAFVRAVRTARSQPDDRAVLLHTHYGSGRSVAVFEAALDTWAGHGGRTLLVYPDGAAARAARHLFVRALDRVPDRAGNPRHALVGEDVLQHPDVVFCAADQIADVLLPSRSDAVVQFLGDVGLVAFEDIERYSGVRATNLAMVVRRLLRVLHRVDARPVLALTLCANPAASSGAREYAQWLAGPYRLVEGALANLAPRKAVHLYLLDAAPRLMDAQGADPLPAIAQLAWATAAWGAPVHMQHAEAVTASDRAEPRWVATLARELAHALPRTPAATSLGLDWTLPEAFVHVRELPLRNLLSAGERVMHGGVRLPCLEGRQLTASDHVVVAVPAMARRGLVRWLARHWIRTAVDAYDAAAGVWHHDIRPLGSRLVKGNPGRALVRQHLHAALAECAGTREDLLTLVSLPGSFDDATGGAVLDDLLDDLDGRHALQRHPNRRLDAATLDVIVERTLSLAPAAHTATPLEAITADVVALVRPEERARRRALRRIDRSRLLRYAYPGCLFHADEQRYRVTVEAFPDGWRRVRAATHEGERWLACEPTDLCAYTEPVIERKWGTPEPAQAAQCSAQQDGVAFWCWRGRFDVADRHVGYWEYRDHGTGGDLSESLHLWAGAALVEEAAAQALVVEFPFAGDASTLVSLRRMLAAAFQAIVDLDAEELDLDVLPSVPAEKGRPGHACLLILDPWGGGAGLLDALGAAPFPFLQNLFKFTWLWADDLAQGDDEVRWAAIGHASARLADTAVAPDPAAVRDVLRGLLGTNARRWHLEESPGQRPLRTPSGQPHAHEPTDYARIEPSAVADVLRTVLGRPPDSTPWASAAAVPLDAVLACWEWHHAHIRYQSDESLYGRAEYVASVTEVLRHHAGDCEDHANLLGSLLVALGGRVALILGPRHAFLAADVSGHDEAALRSHLLAGSAGVSRGWGLAAGEYPNNCGLLAQGWRRARHGGFERTGVSPTAHFVGGQDIRCVAGPAGGRWLLLDPCSTRVAGDVSGLVRMGCLRGDGSFVADTTAVLWDASGEARVAAIGTG